MAFDWRYSWENGEFYTYINIDKFLNEMLKKGKNYIELIHSKYDALTYLKSNNKIGQFITVEKVQDLYKFGAVDVFIPYEVSKGWADSLRITFDLTNSDLIKLFTIIGNIHPDEFHYIDESTIELWWDDA